MKSLLKFAAIFALLPFFVLTSCNDDSDDPTPAPEAQDQFDDFKTYMVTNDMDVTDVLDGWITSATAVHDAMDDYFVIDIRQEADFNNGHIAGAVNATLGNLLEKAADANGKTIVVACYTGQTAGVAVVALRLSGYPTAKVLKWGMSSWSPLTNGSWVNNVGDVAIGDENWAGAPGEITADTPMDAPELLYEPDVTMEEILADRVATLLDGGLKGVANTAALANNGDYFINNYWALTDVEHYGNIKTAHRILPLTLQDGEYAYLDGAGKVLTYCWTGQTSSMLTAYLIVMGYDAYTLTFGANGMIYSNLESHKFSADTETMDYDLVSTTK
jgi:rhodanese-related sulfurtransferase